MKDGTQFEDLTQLQENSVQRKFYYSGGAEGAMITSPCNGLLDDTLRIGVIIGFRVFVDEEVANKEEKKNLQIVGFKNKTLVLQANNPAAKIEFLLQKSIH